VGVRWDLNPAPNGDVTHDFLFFFVAMVRANRSGIKLDLRNWLVFEPSVPNRDVDGYISQIIHIQR
jgi:hypothetical protein